jgi:hypothetical protein
MGVHKYALRVPDELWVELEAAAKANHRSVNQEIVWRLRQPGAAAVAGEVAVGLAPMVAAMDESLRRAGVDPAFVAGRPKFKPDFGGRLKK